MGKKTERETDRQRILLFVKLASSIIYGINIKKNNKNIENWIERREREKKHCRCSDIFTVIIITLTSTHYISQYTWLFTINNN